MAHLQKPQGLAAKCRAELLQAFEQAFEKTPRISIALAQAKPEAAPVAGQRLAELNGQRTLAKPRRCIHQ